MTVTIGARIVTGFAIALSALLVIAGISYKNLQELNQTGAEVLHTLLVLEEKERISSTLAGLQASARAYALTGTASFRQGFESSSHQIRTQIATLRTGVSGDREQEQRVDQLAALIDLRVQSAQELIRARDRAGNSSDPQILELVRTGNDITASMRALILEFERDARRTLDARRAAADGAAAFTAATVLYGTLIAFIFVALASWLLTRSVREPLRLLTDGVRRIARGEYKYRVPVMRKDEIGALARVFNEMAEQIEQRKVALAAEDWRKTTLARFSRLFEGQSDASVLSREVLSEIGDVLDIPYAALYTPDIRDANRLKLQAGHAVDAVAHSFVPGQGLVGQCFSERRRIIVSPLPDGYIKVRSGLGSASPSYLVVFPAILDGEVKAVVELAAFRPLSEQQLALLAELAASIAIVLNRVEAGERTEELLRHAQALSERLEERNDELQAQTEKLQQSEQLLQQQQEELQQTNEELRQRNEEMEQTNEEMEQTNQEMEERNTLLAEQKAQLERANREVEAARQAFEEQSRKLTLTSKYKSEFLANMSHELRTPLNSMLILSSLLAENTGSNLTSKQVQHARTIHASGTDLLALINDILDLSKIEAGAVDVDIEPLPFIELQRMVEDTFRPVADSQQLDFRVELDERLPAIMDTDERKLQQILKNLLSNAFKFTERGSVALRIYPAAPAPHAGVAQTASSVIAFAVQDSGIGIAEDRQDLIFDAFQQADGSTARKYGGTGLGLSISRQLARVLGGNLELKSSPGQGSTFTLYLPGDAAVIPGSQTAERPRHTTMPRVARADAPVRCFIDADEVDIEPAAIADDRENLQPGDTALLIVEDDARFAGVLADFARDKGFKTLIASTASAGIALARRYRPAAITLDLRLPDRDGRVVLDILKHDPATRHIPVHVISVDDARDRILKQGAVSYLQKPVTRDALERALNDTIDFINRPVKSLLIVEDDAIQRASIVELIGEGDVRSTAVGTAAEALDALEKDRFDCLVVDLLLPDMGGLDLIKEIHRRHGGRSPPVIVYTAKALSRREETELRRLSEAIIVKDVRSPERLLDETALFLHRVQSKLPDSKRRLLEQVQRDDAVLSGRKVLVIDDDVRNIFAITSALESYRMQVVYAESGSAGLELLDAQPDIDAVLMDVMMPEMDGYEATRRIRQIDRFHHLPIIMVTAKAMKGDREKSLAAGASDYITKPVDMDQLRSLLRVWLYR